MIDLDYAWNGLTDSEQNEFIIKGHWLMDHRYVARINEVSMGKKLFAAHLRKKKQEEKAT